MNLPKYKSIFKKQVMDEYKSNTNNSEKLMEDINELLEKNKCIKNEDQLFKSKWITTWTCIKRWYHQFCFSVGIYENSNNELIIIFNNIQLHKDDFKYYIELHTEIINQSKYIDPGILKDYNKASVIRYTKKLKKDSINEVVDNILKCYDVDINEENSRILAYICDGNMENHIHHQNVILKHYPNLINEMLRSKKSIIIQYCGQALIYILVKYKKENDIKDRLKISDYDPYNDNDYKIGINILNIICNRVN